MMIAMAVTLRFARSGHEWQHCQPRDHSCQGAAMLKNIVLLAIPGVAPFEFGVVCEVFGIDRSDTGGPAFDFTIVTADPGPVTTSLGYDMHIMNGLDAAADADLI